MRICTKCNQLPWNGKKNTSFCEPCYKEYMILWRKDNREKIKLSKKHYIDSLPLEEKMKQKEKTKLYQAKLYIKNKKEIKERVKNYRIKNKDKINENKRKYRKNNIHEKFRRNLSGRIRTAVKAQYSKKLNYTEKLLGCNISFFLGYLSSKFQPGMTWENYGINGWHVDHIIPCVSFDLSIEENQYKCFHYTNLQPLWAKDNLSKGKKTNWINLL